MNTDSKYSNDYYDHVMGIKPSTGNLAIVFDIINDISNRRGIGNEFDEIDADIQDEIVEKWLKLIENHVGKHLNKVSGGFIYPSFLSYFCL